MTTTRIKGQEVEVMLVVNNEVQSSLSDIQSFEMNLEFETSEEGFLGEKTNRYDEIFKGVSGSIEMHNSSPDTFAFFQAIKDRAQRQSPGTIVNVKATLAYPSGLRKRIIAQDLFFDPMGISFGGRSEFGTTKLDFKCSDYRAI